MFHKIDLARWERLEYYEHFMHNVPCTYSMTVQLDVTKLRRGAKEHNFKFYAAMIYIFTRVVNRHDELRMARDAAGALGFYDVCHPSYTIPNALKTGFSGIWTKTRERFWEFSAAYDADVAEYSKSTKYAPKPNQPENTFYISCVPWVSFTALDVDIHDDAQSLTPRVTIGKYFEQGARTLLPVSIQLHHAVCDGYHASRFFLDAQALANSEFYL